MGVDIHKLIAAIVPDVYCAPSAQSKVKKAVEDDKKRIIAGVEAEVQAGIRRRELELEATGSKLSSVERSSLENKLRDDAQKKAPPVDYVKIANEIAVPKDYEEFDFSNSIYGNFMNSAKKLINSPIELHKLSYDASGETLEPLYFWIVDSVVNLGFTKVEKLIDNFASSVGSGHFSEMGAKSSRMQEESMKMFGTVNAVMKSILNIVYDLKEFKIRLETYDQLKSKDDNTKKSAMYSLKQIWMDSVDVKRGTTSLKGLAQNFDYVTLIDAFMIAGNPEEINKMDLNERVKRILQQRYSDFERWIKESEVELRKRYEIEKIYLKSQYNTIKLYSKWIRPYLEAAQKLNQKADMSNPGLVNMFNTTIFELAILAKAKYDPNEDVAKGDLPKIFKDSNKRKCSPILIFEFKFRSIPDKFGQNYAFRGRSEISFAGYALNEDEITLIKQQLERSDMGDLMKMIIGSTDESLAQIQSDIDSLLPEEKEGKKVTPSTDDVNPFKELFQFFKNPFSSSSEGSEKKWADSLSAKKDSDIDKVNRSRCILTARMRCTKFYEIYKKVHKMQAFGAIEDAF